LRPPAIASARASAEGGRARRSLSAVLRTIRKSHGRSSISASPRRSASSAFEKESWMTSSPQLPTIAPA
jgi:hypothetical protein